MGMCTEVYLLDFQRLSSMLDGENAEMKALVLSRRYPSFMQSIERHVEEGTSAQARLTDLLCGRQPDSRAAGCSNAYALRVILREIAQSLSNTEFCPYRLDWLDSLDQAAKNMGLKNWNFSDFISFNPPIAMPPPDDFPGIHTLTAEATQEMHSHFSALKIKHTDTSVVKALKQAKGWFKTAAEAQSGLVFFTL